MRVLITGALGWLGRSLSEVVSRTHRVRALDLAQPEWRRERFDFEGETLAGDVTDFEQMRAAVAGQDAIIHAAVADTVTRDRYQPGDAVPFDVNLRGTFNVLEAGRLAGVRRVVLIGAAETHVAHPAGAFVEHHRPYAGDGCIYDLTKRLQESIAEWFVHHHRMGIVVLRLGDLVDLERACTKRDDADWRRSIAGDGWLHRYDVGEACLRAIEIAAPGYEVFHLVGAPAARKTFDVARTEEALGLRFTRIDPGS